MRGRKGQRLVLLGALIAALLGREPGLTGAGAAEEPPPAYVLVIRGVNLGPDAAWMARLAKEASEAVISALQQAKLPYRETTDSEIAHGWVDPAQAAALIAPYNRAMTPAEVNLISNAMDRGVALIAFHIAGERLETRLGVKTGDFAQVAEGTKLRLRPDTVSLVGAPAAMTASPVFVRGFAPLDESIKIVGWWEGDSADEARPAVALSESGCFLGFVPRAADGPALSGLLVSILGQVAPRVVSKALPGSAAELGPVGPYASLAALMNVWRARMEGAEPEAWEYAKQSEAALWKVRNLNDSAQTAQAQALVKQARDLATRAYWASFYSRVPEIRGAWACPWPQAGARGWDQAMARLAQANFNVVFPYVASAGVAYYPSGVLPRAAEGQMDYLQAAVTAGQAAGIEVHPRLLALQCLFTPKTQKTALAAQGRLVVNGQGKTGDWLCPTDPRNQEQLLALATEIVLRYPVQGLQLDYYRFDATDTCMCARCRTEFERAAGVKPAKWPQEAVSGPLRPRFLQWRAEVLTELLRALRTQLRALRPQVRLSVATFPNWRTTQDYVGQMPAAWAKQGLVDFLCPMDYTDDLKRFQGYVEEQMTQLGGAVPLAVGIGAFADNCPFSSPQQLAEQIEATRRQRAAGFVVFNYNQRFVTDFLPWIELGLTRRPAAPGWRP